MERIVKKKRRKKRKERKEKSNRESSKIGFKSDSREFYAEGISRIFIIDVWGLGVSSAVNPRNSFPKIFLRRLSRRR